MSHWFWTIAVCLFSISTYAKGDSGISMEFSAGLPSVSIENSENEKALYSGLAFGARGVFPAYAAGSFVSALTLSYRYLDLDNTANNETQTESAEHSGIGGGIRLSLSKIFLGGEFHAIQGDHVAVGSIDAQEKFRYNLISYYAGLSVPFSKELNFNLSYNLSQATIDTAEGNSPYQDNVIWLRMTLKFKTSIADVFWD